MKNKYISETDKLFISGANGMVGSAISRFLEKTDFELINKKNLLIPSRKDLDLSDPYQVNLWFKKNRPDIVIIAAAKVGGINANKNYPYEFLIQNLKIQNNIIDASRNFEVKRLLFLGSSCIYPKYSKQPIKEEYLLEGQLEETNQCYAIAKIAGIKLIEAIRKEYKFDAISLMPTNLYGPHDNYDLNDSHVLPALIRKFYEAKRKNFPYVICWGSGEPLREFLHVDDLAEACIFCLCNWDPSDKYAPKDIKGNELSWLNIGSSEEISIKNLAQKIANEIDYRGEIIWDRNKPDGTPRKLLDSSRINNLGWKAKISIEKGIKKTILDYQNENIF